MDWVQVALGILAGVVYSLVGWLRNKMNYDKDLPDEEEIAEAIVHLKEDREKARLMAEAIVTTLLERAWELKGSFNKREFAITVAQGLVIGLLMGGLGMPVDIAVAFAAQIGLLTLVRKLVGLIKF